MGGGDGEPRPYTLAVPRVRHPSISGTLFAHARGIYLKRKSELPLPAHARCTCARHAARTLTRHHLAALSLVLPWYSRLVQIIQTSRESDHECSYETFSFRSPSSSVGSYEKMLLGCIGRMEESRNELIRNSVYRSNLFVPGTMDIRERLEEEKRFSGSSFSSRKNNFQFTFDSKYLKNNS